MSFVIPRSHNYGAAHLTTKDIKKALEKISKSTYCHKDCNARHEVSCRIKIDDQWDKKHASHFSNPFFRLIS